MLTLIKGATLYAPQLLGKKDMLLAGGKIEQIADEINIEGNLDIEVIDGTNLIAAPGFIDQHVHLIGGGGENGYSSRTPEVTLSNITRWGITTVVGLLGTDGTSRHMESLLSKAMGLEEEGISTYIYSGSYEVPMVTLTGSLRRDILLIEKVVGAGEIAISDHRSSAPDISEIEDYATQARVAGMLSRKAGVVHLHVGSGKDGLSMINEIVKRSDIPIYHFRPTHCNRCKELFDEATEFGKNGGMVDITSSVNPVNKESTAIKPSKAVKQLLENGVAKTNITMSSDGNGSLPVFDSKGNITGLAAASLSSMYYELKDMVLNENIPLETALPVLTSNVADGLKLQGKGHLEACCDADVTLLDKDFNIQYVIAKGRKMVEKGEVIVKGVFE